MAGLTRWELERILGIEPGDVFRCSVHLISRQVTQLPPQSQLRKRNALCMLITKLQANGNGRHVTRPPPQSELQKRNALSVLKTELQANGKQVTQLPPLIAEAERVFKTEVPENGNGRQVTRPPLQTELRKPNAIRVFITEVQAQTGHAAFSAK